MVCRGGFCNYAFRVIGLGFYNGLQGFIGFRRNWGVGLGFRAHTETLNFYEVAVRFSTLRLEIAQNLVYYGLWAQER